MYLVDSNCLMIAFITLRASKAAAQCIVIAPVCVFVCGSALLQPGCSVCVASEHFFQFMDCFLVVLVAVYNKQAVHVVTQ